MINITFKDGSVKQFESGVTAQTLASTISTSLAKTVIAAKFNNKALDVYTPLTCDGTINLITITSSEGLDILRHDATHIMAQAVKELFPTAQLAIGPTIDNGFYYDFAYERSFTPDDLVKIERRMHDIVKQNLPIRRSVMTKQEAIDYFKRANESYKVQIISELPDGEEISIYTQGEFVDPCRGPHSPSTGNLKAFKLLKVAGAYWRGDSKNPMLQRIYGTAFATEKELDEYLFQLQEAEKRDHRKLAKEMDLFHFQEEAPGSVFWHPNGLNIMQTLIAYMRKKQKAMGYVEIATPELLDRCFWEQSGHWQKYSSNMFVATAESEDKVFAIKPMNCPGCVQIYKHTLRSYRDLPLRMSEFGKVHRFESSGALHGLMRVRAFTQDDAHVFVAEDQLMQECKRICEFMLYIYKDFGFSGIEIKFSDRPNQRIGSDEVWDKAEAALLAAAKYAGLECVLNKGEGAFYGPKLEFTLYDAIRRPWQVGTLQVDLNLPERLDATYIGEDGQRHRPVMLHQATFGSLERFIGILLEHYSGKLPLWLAPIQVAVVTITSDADDYANKVADILGESNIRVLLDCNNEKINYKVRKHSLTKVPIILALGKNELQNNTVCVRRLGSDKQEIIELQKFLDKVKEEVQSMSE